MTLVDACGDQHASPTEVMPSMAAAAAASASSCPRPEAVERQILALVPREDREGEDGEHRGRPSIRTVDFDRIVIAYRLGKVTQARLAMFQLWSKVLKAYFANQLAGGMSSTTQAAVLALGKAFYCTVGLDGSQLTLGTNPLDPNNVVAVVFPSTTTQTVVTGNGRSGVQIPPNTLTAPTTITITLIPGPFPEFTGPLNTRLDQFGPFFQYTAVPESSIGDSVTVSTCFTDTLLPVSRAHLAHNVGTGLEILRVVPTFLTCNATSFAPPEHRGVFAALRNLFVTDAYAASFSIGIGGKTKSFSPFGVVDTLVTVQANSLTQQQAPAGSPVASPPSVLVQTLGAHTHLGGVGVAFSIVQGAGQLTGASAITDTSGVATVGSWSIGVGQNIVNAVATFPALARGVGVSVAGNPVADTATGGDVFPYLGTNYRFLLASTGDTAGFFQPGFNDAGWGVGNAAFGSGSVPGQTCPLDNTVATLWNNNPAPSAMLLRKTFPWPAKGTGTTTLQLGVAIDNDIQVYINGTDITSTAQGGTVQADGYLHHEGCAAQDSYTFSISDAMLVAGSNLVAIRARDRGTVAYVDARLSVQP